MNENTDKHLDDLARKILKESSLEQPSMDFTKHVMAEVNSLQTSKTTTYVPLISKRTWSVLAVVMVALLLYIGLQSKGSQNHWLEAFNWNAITDFELGNPLSKVEFSQTFLYAMVLFGIMICIQIPILKHYFNQRLKY